MLWERLEAVGLEYRIVLPETSDLGKDGRSRADTWQYVGLQSLK